MAKKKATSKKKPAPKKKVASAKKATSKKKATLKKKATKKVVPTKRKAAPKKKAAAPKKTSLIRDLRQPKGWRAWCNTQSIWIGPWRTDEATANQDAQPHIDTNHITEIKLQF
jgi:hypothetical protein